MVTEAPAPSEKWFAELIGVLDEFRKIHGGLILPDLASASKAGDQPAISRSLRAQIWRLRGYREGVLHGSEGGRDRALELSADADTALMHASKLLLALELDWGANLPPPAPLTTGCPKCSGTIPITKVPGASACWACSTVVEVVALVMTEPVDAVAETLKGQFERIAKKVTKAFPRWDVEVGHAGFRVRKQSKAYAVHFTNKYALSYEESGVSALVNSYATEKLLVRALFKELRSGKPARKRSGK